MERKSMADKDKSCEQNQQNKLIISLIIKDKLFGLCQNTSCDSDFLTKCVQFRGLTVSEKNEIEKEPVPFKRNLKFYNKIGEKDIVAYRQIIKTMKESQLDTNIIGILEEEGRGIKDIRRQTAIY